jgi:hypothetical protein
MTKRNNERHNDQARELRRDASRTSEAWGVLRDSYSDDVRSLVDHIDDAGGLALGDLVRLELAELFSMRAELEAASGERTIERLSSLMLQCRKNLRTIVTEMGAGVSIDQAPVKVPDWVEALLGKQGGAIDALRILLGPDVNDEVKALLAQAQGVELARDLGDEIM